MKFQNVLAESREKSLRRNPAVNSNIAVFSYDKDAIIYCCKDGEEYLEDTIRSGRTTENTNVVPYVTAERYYPELIIEAFVGMRLAIDRKGDTGKVYSKSIKVKGYQYDLMAWITETERLGKICVFTCHHTGYRKNSAIKKNKDWYRKLFKHWYGNGLQEPDPRYWHDEMWCTDVRGKTVEEIVSRNAESTPVGHEPISDILSQVMKPGVLEASEVRTGYPPVCLLALRAPPLDLIFVQRFRLIKRDSNI